MFGRKMGKPIFRPNIKKIHIAGWRAIFKEFGPIFLYLFYKYIIPKVAVELYAPFHVYTPLVV